MEDPEAITKFDKQCGSEEGFYKILLLLLI